MGELTTVSQDLLVSEINHALGLPPTSQKLAAKPAVSLILKVVGFQNTSSKQQKFSKMCHTRRNQT